MEERREGPPFAAFAQSFQGRRKKRKNGGNNTPTKLFSSAPNSASCLPCPLATLIASKRARWTQRAETGPRARGLQKDQNGLFWAWKFKTGFSLSKSLVSFLRLNWCVCIPRGGIEEKLWLHFSAKIQKDLPKKGTLFCFWDCAFEILVWIWAQKNEFILAVFEGKERDLGGCLSGILA